MKSIKLLLGTLITLLLVISAKGQAGDYFYSTLDPNSTPGDFYGGLYLSFSNNDIGQSFTPVTYTVPGAQMGLNFFLSQYEEPNYYALNVSFSFSDSRFDGATLTWTWPGDPAGFGYFPPGQTWNPDFNYGSGNINIYSYPSGGGIGAFSLDFNLPVDYDGTSGNGVGVGSWSLTYTITSPVPEPAVGWLIALGGFGLWWARGSRHRQRQLNN